MMSIYQRVALPQEDQVSLTGLSAQATLEWTDSKIQALEQYLQGLKLFRDIIRTVTRLPSELLVEIFRHVQGEGQFPRTSWIKVTHVCSHWRAVALTTPTLWSNIDIGKNCSLFRAYLERSGDVKVNISLSHKARHEATVSSLLSQHARRISRLQVTRQAGERLLPFLHFPMPNLESLALNMISGECTLESQDGDDESDEEHLDIFAPVSDSFPQLRFVSLQRVLIPWTSRALTSLTHLELSNIRRGQVPSMGILLDILERCPDLEFLSLTHCGPVFPDDAAPSRTVSLPKLQHLHMTTIPTEVPCVLARLVLPTSVSLELKLDLPRDGLEDEDESGIFISAAFPHDKSRLGVFSTLRDVSLYFNNDIIEIRADPVDADSPHPRFRMFSYSKECRFKFILCVGHEAARLFTSSPVATLSIHDEFSLLDSEWESLLDCMPSVEELHVFTDSEPVGKVFMTLKRLSDTSGTPICPHLREIDVEGMVDDEFEMGRGVLRLLRTRHERGVRDLELLSIASKDEIALSMRTRQGLESLVGLLIIDGHQPTE
ncbi:hypothetical protein B0H21DRAFT_123948 [Amylocystis lapponica]|nr:hypothetical protein B0H21DRAFT_123948 [Amylocystis lapponica]